MTRAYSYIAIGANGLFNTTGSYEMGFLYCARCEKWVHKDDTQNTWRGKRNIIRHAKPCSQQLKSRPNSSKWRKRINDKKGVKYH